MLAFPPTTSDVSSEYAEEGTFAHACMDVLMKHRMQHGRTYTNQVEVDNLLGLHIYDRVVTQAHIDDMIVPALEALAELETFYGDGFRVLTVELGVRFPNVPGAFGTMDLVLGNNDTVLHVDWKFGAGVPVKALYKDPAGDLVNAQLLFYIAGAKHSARHLYKGRPNLVAAIVQPRTSEPLTHTLVTPKELKWFVQDVEAAVVKAVDHNPPRHRGEHCRFAACKATCPLWTGPMLDMIALPGSGAFEAAVSQKGEVTPYGEYLSKAKTLSDIAAQFKTEIDEQLHAYLEAGGLVPGWRLKAKVKQRKWINDEGHVAERLRQFGFTDDEIWKRELQTFAVTDKVAKRRGVNKEVLDRLRAAPASTETTIAPVDDPAPVVNKPLASEQFRAALAQITAETRGR